MIMIRRIEDIQQAKLQMYAATLIQAYKSLKEDMIIAAEVEE
jgi:hypothetical protein